MSPRASAIIAISWAYEQRLQSARQRRQVRGWLGKQERPVDVALVRCNISSTLLPPRTKDCFGLRNDSIEQRFPKYSLRAKTPCWLEKIRRPYSKYHYSLSSRSRRSPSGESILTSSIALDMRPSIGGTASWTRISPSKSRSNRSVNSSKP